jgi:hypothetical protein
MKKITVLIFLFIYSGIYLFAQAPPQGINYQAVARNTSGAELQNTPLTVRIGIYTDAAATNQAYEETHAVTTNSFGLFNVIIGQGTQTSVNAFSTILWANSAYYLKVEIDGGSGFTNMGTTQLMSVPYALYAGASAGGPTGSTGATGPQGPTGAIGATGANGATGTAGANGATGTAGTNGTNGATGATGATGTAGTNGATGPTGAGTHCWDLNNDGINDPAEDVNSDGNWNSLDCIGATGAAGPTGAAGAQGATGTAGTNGATGPIGPTGVTGTAGTNGATGPTGAAGTNGANGATGPTGAAGTNGANGATGPTGAAGTNGANGATGATGAAGTNGTNGATGATGAAGTNGANGATGPTGAAGTNGTNGATGPTGAAGTNGTNGATGAAGTNGTNGATGPTGAAGTNGTNGATGPTGAAGTNGTNGATGPTGAAGTNGTNGVTGPTGATGATGSFSPVGSTGQTIYHNGSAWTPTSNLYSDGTNVAIGTTPFSARLTIQGAGNTSATGSLNVFNSTSASLFYVRNDGAVGIGTTTPNNGTLDVQGTINAVTSYKIANSVGSNGQYLRSDGSTGFIASTILASDLPAGATAWTVSGGYIRPTVLTNQVLVGTSSGGFAAFEAHDITGSGVSIVGESNNGSNSSIYVNSTGVNANSGFGIERSSSVRAYWGVNSSNDIFMNTGVVSNFFYVKGASGNVGIGTTNPQTTFAVGNNTGDKFQVAGSDGHLVFTDQNASILFQNPAAGSPPEIYMFTSGTANVDRMIIAHSPSYPGYGLQYSDATDVFNFTNGSSSALTVDLINLRVGVLNNAPGYTLDVNGNFNTSGFRMNVGSSLSGKVLTSDASGNGSWQAAPLSPSKFGSLGSAYTINNTSQYSYTPVIMTVTPTQSGVLNLSAEFGYNFSTAATSMVDVGFYVVNSATPPNAATPFSNSGKTIGFATTIGTAFGTMPVSILYSMNVVAGQTYYIYIGTLDGTNSNQTSANMIAPKVIATLNSSTGL